MVDAAQLEEFEKALKFVLYWEGGYSDDPQDHGGRTNYGITEAEYIAWKHKHGEKGDWRVAGISMGEVHRIYPEEYWLAAHCGRLPHPASLALFDSVVNCGLRQGVKFLQRALGVKDDGEAGPVTWAAAAKADPKTLCRRIGMFRAKFYDSLVDEHPNQMRFLRGWRRRASAVMAEADR